MFHNATMPRQQHEWDFLLCAYGNLCMALTGSMPQRANLVWCAQSVRCGVVLWCVVLAYRQLN